MKTGKAFSANRKRKPAACRRIGFCAVLLAVSVLVAGLPVLPPAGLRAVRAEEVPATPTGEAVLPGGATGAATEMPETGTPAPGTAAGTPQPQPDTEAVSRFVVPRRRSSDGRLTVSLDGVWYAAVYGGDFFERYDGEPLDFTGKAAVPGLLRDAEEDGCAVYRQTFTVEGMNTGDRAFLEIGGARFGRRVFINGLLAGSCAYNYSTSRFDVTDLLLEGENEIVILLGNGAQQIEREGDPAHVFLDERPESRWPGITDSVTLTVTGSVYVGEVRIAPSIGDGMLTVTAEIENTEALFVSETVEITVYELGIVEDGVNSMYNGVGFVAAEVTVPPRAATETESVQIRIRAFAEEKQWSPENPYLYEIEIRTGGDAKRLRFGMRTFSVQEETGRLMLNEKPFFLTGAALNFDALYGVAGERVWEKEWVGAMLRRVKELGLTAVKANRSVLPQFWYDLADELGMALIAEYPFGSAEDPCGCSSQTLLPELRAIQSALGSHASVWVWDVKSGAEGETAMRQVIYALRGHDLQNRPFDNGASPPVSGSDWIECDVTALREDLTLEDLGGAEFAMRHWQTALPWSLRDYGNAKVIVNYAEGFAVDASGGALPETEALWKKWLPGAGNAERLQVYDETVAALTEYWRASRKYMGLFLPEQVFLTDFLPDGEPFFRAEAAELIRNAFSPVGITVEYYAETGGRGDALRFDVAVMNDTFADVGGIEVTVQLLSGSSVLYSETKQYDSIRKFGTESRDIVRREFNLTIPATVTDNTEITLTASFLLDGRRVESSRRILVNGGAMYESPASQWVVTGGIGLCALLIGGASVVAFSRMRQSSAAARRSRSQQKKG